MQLHVVGSFPPPYWESKSLLSSHGGAGSRTAELSADHGSQCIKQCLEVLDGFP